MSRLAPALFGGCFGVVAALGLLTYSFSNESFTLSFDVRNSTVGPAEPQFFFKFHPTQEFTQELSSFHKEENGRVQFTFSGYATNLRIDPMVQIGSIDLCQFVIRNGLGLTIWEWNESSSAPWVPLNDLEAPLWKSNCLSLKSTGNDPFLATLLPINLRTLSESKNRNLAIWFGLFCALAMWPFFSALFSSLIPELPKTTNLPATRLAGLAAVGLLLTLGFGIALKVAILQKPSLQPESYTPKHRDFQLSLVDYHDRLLFSKGKYFIYLHPTAGYRALPGIRSESFNLDERGFRQTILSTRTRLRVGMTGGSTAFGLDTIGDENTIASLLVKMNPEIQTTNMAHIGYTLGQEVSLVFWDVASREFDVLVALSGWNDFVVHQAVRELQLPHHYQNILAPFYETLSLIRGFTQQQALAFGKSRPPAVQTDDLVSLRKSVIDRLLKFSSVAREKGAEFAFFFQPDICSRKNPSAQEREILEALERRGIESKDYPKFTRDVEREANALGLRVFDLNSSQRLQMETESVFSDRVHLTQLGNQIVAEEIMKTMGWKK